jgi:uncharacterized protein
MPNFLNPASNYSISMINETMIGEIEKEARSQFKELGPCHDWSHVERVLKTAVFIAKKEGADERIVRIASYLHDIGRKKLKEPNYDHAVEGAKMARKILGKYALTQEETDNICHCIETHRFRNDMVPKTREAMCLHDADKLDVLGALGIARAYIYLGETNDCVIYLKPEEKDAPSKERTNSVQEEYENKYKHIPERMMTRAGKVIAESRLKYMEAFLERLEKEVQGKA